MGTKNANENSPLTQPALSVANGAAFIPPAKTPAPTGAAAYDAGYDEKAYQ